MLKISFKNIIYLVLYAVPNTIFSFGILYIINTVISGEKSFLANHTGIVFLSIVIITYLINIVFQRKLNQYAFKMLYKNEKIVFDKILKTPLITLEKLGSQRFYTAVEDLRVFAFLPETVTHTINSLLMLLLCIAYLFTLSVSSAFIIVILAIALSGLYFFIINAMSRQVEALRKYNESYYEYVNDVMKGFKELKTNSFRRKNLMHKFLSPNRDNAEKLDFKINYIFLSINLISQYGLYLIIGIVLFLLPELGLLKSADIISYIVIILFMAGPINNLINMQNIYTRFSVANKRINNFLKDFNTTEVEVDSVALTAAKFHSLEFRNIYFAYENEAFEKTFALGPINLTIEKGETIFIVGGNGSGKSTFINTLTGLYAPSKGELVLNKDLKTNVKAELQNLMASIFTDNYIFSHNYDNYAIENNTKYRELLKIMELNNIVTDDKEESVRRKFSKGQSKRISMIFALLENRPILVLDEWAADQDPHFRKYFYEVLLPILKNEGKTIIAVTHDDAYFKHADRIIKFDYGQIVKDVKAKDGSLAAENFWQNN